MLPFALLTALAITTTSTSVLPLPDATPTPPGSWLFAETDGRPVQDPLTIEALLAEHSVGAERATLLSTRSGEDRTRVRHVRLADGQLLDAGAVSRMSNCTPVARETWTGGAIEVHPRTAAEDMSQPASLVLVKDHPEVDSFVILSPGDSAESRSVRRDGQTVKETVSLRHADEVLELRRVGDHASVCYTQAE